MSIKNISQTKAAFLVLLLHLAYAILFTVFRLITGLLEAPCNQEGIYVVFAAISIALLCFYPFVATGINITSIIFQISALRKNESKIKNIIMTVTAILFEMIVVIFFAWFWRGAMGI